MKTSYIAIAALGLAAAVLFNVRYGKHEKQVLPSYPVPSEPARPEAAELPPLPTIPKAVFPEINPPAEEGLVIPASSSPVITLPAIPASGESPAPELIQIPVIPQPLPQGSSTGGFSNNTDIWSSGQTPPPPTVPGVPTVPLPPTAPYTQPMSPLIPTEVNPNNSTAPNPLQAPAPPVPVGKQTIATRGFYDSPGNNSGLPKPPLSMEPTSSSTTFTPHGKFVVLKGKEIAANADEYKKMIGEIMACKLIAIEGIGSANGKEVVVQQGSIVRNIPKVEVLFVGETRNDVYHYMRDRVPANDEVARLAVARWCMFNGLREQALAEAKEILRVKPGSKNAADMARSLEESLKQFPTEGATTASKPQEVNSVNVAESDIEITPEAATTFATRVQPILANLCIDCHARSDHAGPFKLTRITGFEGGPQSSLANLRATVGQLVKSDPSSSPLLTKAITAHGGLREPPFKSRQASGFLAIENWVVLAVGPGSGAPVSGNQIGAPNSQPTQPAIVSTPIAGLPPTQPTVPALPVGLPAVEIAPALPVSNPTASPSVSIPAVPSVPAVPAAVTVPAVLPTPPMMKPTVPTQPPIVPSADHTPGLPSLPMVPPSSTIAIPSAPNGNQPEIGTSSGSQFGTNSLPKPMSPGGPTGRDEFDPGSFNQGTPKK